MYALHYLLPFVVMGILLVHIALLHIMGSGSASTVPGTTVDGDSFLVYYYKDTLLPHTTTTMVLLYAIHSLHYRYHTTTLYS